MNSKTWSLIQEIKKKVKNPIRQAAAFATDNEVIDLAVLQLYEQLKRQKLI